MSAPPRSPRAPVGAAFIGLTFALCGGVLLAQMLREGRHGHHPPDGGIGLAMAALFTVIGLGVLGYAVHLWRSASATRGAAVAHPDEPWLHRRDWAAGEILSTNTNHMFFWWGFAIFWNGMSTPLMWVVRDEILRGNRAAWVAVLFPLVGLGLLVAAIRVTLQRLKYGRCRLVLSSLPAPLGGDLEGLILVPAALLPEADPSLTLRCLQRVTSGSGKNRQTHTYTLWQREVQIDRTRWQTGPRGAELPVLIRIDADCRPTNDGQRISWELTAAAATPGIDFTATFEVPVFPVGVPARPHSRPATQPAVYRQHTPEERLREAGIRWEEAGPTGAPALVFPPARAYLSAVLGLVFAAAAFAGSYLLRQHGAPFFAAALPAFFGAIALWGALSSIGGEARVTLEPRGIVLSTRGVFGRKLKCVDPQLIRGVTASAGQQQGTAATYRLMFTCDAPKQGGSMANALMGQLLQMAAERSGKKLDRLPGLPIPLGGSIRSHAAAQDIATFLEGKLRERYQLAGDDDPADIG